VEATFDFVEGSFDFIGAPFDIVAFDSVALTLLLVSTGISGMVKVKVNVAIFIYVHLSILGRICHWTLLYQLACAL